MLISDKEQNYGSKNIGLEGEEVIACWKVAAQAVPMHVLSCLRFIYSSVKVFNQRLGILLNCKFVLVSFYTAFDAYCITWKGKRRKYGNTIGLHFKGFISLFSINFESCFCVLLNVLGAKSTLIIDSRSCP